jgi:hypothetical protein
MDKWLTEEGPKCGEIKNPKDRSRKLRLRQKFQSRVQAVELCLLFLLFHQLGRIKL